MMRETSASLIGAFSFTLTMEIDGVASSNRLVSRNGYGAHCEDGDFGMVDSGIARQTGIRELVRRFQRTEIAQIQNQMSKLADQRNRLRGNGDTEAHVS